MSIKNEDENNKNTFDVVEPLIASEWHPKKMEI